MNSLAPNPNDAAAHAEAQTTEATAPVEQPAQAPVEQPAAPTQPGLEAVAGTPQPETVSSTSDARTVNNVMRHEYKVLSDVEKKQMQDIKDAGLALHEMIASFGESRELSLAKTKIEESVMWTVKHITG